MSDAHRDEIAKLETLYEEHPEGRIFTHLAEAYRKAGELDRAHEVLTNGIGRHPDYSSAHVVLGRVLTDQNRSDEATTAFQRVLELDAHNLIAIRALGDLARDRGDRDSALEYYHRLLDQEPSEEVQGLVEELEREDAPVGTAGDAEEPGAFDGPSFEEPDTLDIETYDQSYAPAVAEAGASESDDLDAAWGAEGATSEEDEERDITAGGELPPDETQLEGSAGEPGSDEVRIEEPDEPSAGFESADVGTDAVETGAAFTADEEGEWATTPPEPEEEEDWEGVWSDAGSDDDAAEVEAAPAFEEEDGSDEMRTETIAQVYARQGLYDLAAEVYRELVRSSPGDDRLQARLAEMEELARNQQAEREVEPIAGLEARGPDVESEAPATEPIEGFEAGELDPGGAEATPIEGLEMDEEPAPEAEEPVDTAAVGVEAPDDEDSVWTESGWDAQDDDAATPHAWVEEDAQDGSQPIRAYFDDLLAWSADAREPVSEPGEALAAAESAPDPDETAPETDSGGRAAEERPDDGDRPDDDDLDMFRSWLESLQQ